MAVLDSGPPPILSSPRIKVRIDLRYSTDPMKDVADLSLVPYLRTILDFCPSSLLDYWASYRPQIPDTAFRMLILFPIFKHSDAIGQIY